MRHAVGHPVAPASRGDRGAALVVALLTVIVLVGMVLTYARAMRIESQAAANHQASAEAMAVARGAVEAVRAMGDSVPAEGVRVGEGAFWIIRPHHEDDRAHAYGLVDEGGKINLNTANFEMLQKLPRMNDPLAAAVIDWRGGGPAGREAAAAAAGGDWGYSRLPEPYQAKGDVFESVGELLLVHGFNPIVLFGEDANLNHVLDPNEDDGDLLAPPDAADGQLNRGLWNLVTVHSRDPGTTAAAAAVGDVGDEGDAGDVPGEGIEQGGDAVGGGGRGGVNVNSARTSRIRRTLTDVLGEDVAADVASSIRSSRPHRNLMDVMFNAGIDAQQMALIEPLLSVGRGPGGGGGGGGGGNLPPLPGAQATAGVTPININTAPREVLAALPLLDESDADALLDYRASRGILTLEDAIDAAFAGDVMGSIFWIAEVLDQDRAVAIGDVITTRSFVRSADIVAVNSTGRAFERVRVVIDYTDGDGQLVAWQRLTHLGWPLPVEWRQLLRAGAEIESLQSGPSGVRAWR